MDSMSAEENKALARLLIEEVFNAGKLDVADELLAPDYMCHMPLFGDPDVEGFKSHVGGSRRIFPDLHIQIEDPIAEGNRVAMRWTSTGHHIGGPDGAPHQARHTGDAAGDGVRADLQRQAGGGLGGIRHCGLPGTLGFRTDLGDPPARSGGLRGSGRDARVPTNKDSSARRAATRRIWSLLLLIAIRLRKRNATSAKSARREGMGAGIRNAGFARVLNPWLLTSEPPSGS